MPTCRHHKPGHRKVGRKRFPNKSVKVKERAYKQAREIEANLSESPMPSIILDLGVDRVSELIHSITGSNEDAFQDAWEAILGDHVGSEEDILQVAREIRHRHNAEAIAKEYKEASLDEPIGEHKDEHDFTLKDILQSPISPIDAPIRYRHKENQRIILDDETRMVLKQKFPNRSYRDAIRASLGLPPAPVPHPVWQAWEDEIIERIYPWGGSFAVSLELPNRPRSGILRRAQHLNIKFEKFRIQPEWLTKRETQEILGIGWLRMKGFIKKGILQTHEVKYKNQKICYYFDHEAIVSFLKTHIWDYFPELVCKQYQQYIPKTRLEWVTIESVCHYVNCSAFTVRRYIKLGLVSSKRVGKMHVLIRPSEVEKAREYVKTHRAKYHIPKPYKIAILHGLKHCITQDEDNDWCLVCKSSHKIYYPNPQGVKAMNQYKRRWGGPLWPVYPQFKRGKPTCKRCLAIWNKESYQP